LCGALGYQVLLRALKGPDRPVEPEMERAEVLAALVAVDCVTIFDDESVLGVVSRMLPTVLVKRGHYSHEQVVGHAEVEGAGGRVVRIPVFQGHSTTALIQAERKAPPTND
jgi:D-beta-D-heptose 7-phosphate kinase/D-beta-D-heptose 1-phosphate adenosyltransferase